MIERFINLRVSSEDGEYEPEEISTAGRAWAWLALAGFAVLFAYLLFISLLEKSGAYYPYLFGGLTVLYDLIALAHIILFFTSLVKVKYQRFFPLVLCIICTVTAICSTCCNQKYFGDIFSGSRTVITDEYRCHADDFGVCSFVYIELIDESGNKKKLDIPEKTALYLEENPYKSGKPSGNRFPCREKKIVIEYYSCSEILIRAEFV